MSYIRRRIKQFIMPLVGVVMLATFGCGQEDRESQSEESFQKPSFVLVITDDQSIYDLEFMSQAKNLIAGQGIEFKNFFVTWPLCCPSRASFWTGLHSHNHGVKDVKPPNGGFPKFRDSQLEELVVGNLLKRQGYQTAYIGKYLNSYPEDDVTYVPVGWDYWASSASHGLAGSAYYNYKLNINGKVFEFGNTPSDYRTDVEANLAKFFLRSARGKFLLIISPFAPHTPTIPAPRHTNMFANEKAPRYSSFNRTDPANKQWAGNKEMSPDAIERVDQEHRNRIRTLQAVDEMIAMLVKELGELGRLESTYIILTSDNGFHLGDHRLSYQGEYFSKNTYLEKDIKIPFILRGPGVEKSEEASLVANIDLAPTILDIAEVDVSHIVDGTSFRDLFTLRSKAETKKNIYVQIWRKSGETLVTEVLRGERYKFVRDGAQYLFYDLKNDPHEMNNIISEISGEDIEYYKGIMERYQKCEGEECRDLERLEIQGGTSL